MESKGECVAHEIESYGRAKVNEKRCHLTWISASCLRTLSRTRALNSAASSPRVSASIFQFANFLMFVLSDSVAGFKGKREKVEIKLTPWGDSDFYINCSEKRAIACVQMAT